MKIIIKNDNKEGLKLLKKLIDEISIINLEEMELTEENLQKAKELKAKADQIRNLQFRYKGVDVKIVNSDGAELTMIV